MARSGADSFGLNLTNVITLALFAFFINPLPAAPPGFLQRTIDDPRANFGQQ